MKLIVKRGKMLTFIKLLRHFWFIPATFILGIVVLIEGRPSWLTVGALVFFWAAVGAWLMSYIGTAESRRASSVPVKLHFLKKKRWFGTTYALEFFPYYHCFNPECSHYFGKDELKTEDMVPVLGYLLTGGKCRYCHQKYSSETFKMELKGLYLGFLVLPRWYKLVTQNFVGDTSDSVH